MRGSRAHSSKKSIIIFLSFVSYLTVGLKKDYGRIFFDLREDIDKEWVFIDESYVRCHQHASGARHGEERAIGHSRGGNTTKIHLCVDSHGNPLDFKITGGDMHDSQVANDLI